MQIRSSFTLFTNSHGARCCVLLICLLMLASCSPDADAPSRDKANKRWLAGDHHIHSHFSVEWNIDVSPPAPILAGDAAYSIITNAEKAQQFGLSWLVITDHGGPNHSRLNLEMAYPELVLSREKVPDVIQFYGMELNTPGADHSSLIIPHTVDEAIILFNLERDFDKREAYPPDQSRDSEERMLAALDAMSSLDPMPVVIANHPSRSASAYADYGLYDPAELRRWNNVAPGVAIGMSGSPGHQAVALSNGSWITDDSKRVRGYYRRFPTMGGFDQMTARVGGFWDSMLGEGRHWWITANSDSHQHYTEGGADFYPGEYSKTYVWAEESHHSVLDGLRAGHMFVTTGDLITELFVTVEAGNQTGRIGDEIRTDKDDTLLITLRARDPDATNAAGLNPTVKRIDLISGEIIGKGGDLSHHSHPGAQVVARFDETQWSRTGDEIVISHTMTASNSLYIRVRGTNTDELEPLPDPPAEDPWQDLWFYSNPVFVRLDR